MLLVAVGCLKKLETFSLSLSLSLSLSYAIISQL
jgi:hypothetical protein